MRIWIFRCWLFFALSSYQVKGQQLIVPNSSLSQLAQKDIDSLKPNIDSFVFFHPWDYNLMQFKGIVNGIGERQITGTAFLLYLTEGKIHLRKYIEYYDNKEKSQARKSTPVIISNDSLFSSLQVNISEVERDVDVLPFVVRDTSDGFIVYRENMILHATEYSFGFCFPERNFNRSIHEPQLNKFLQIGEAILDYRAVNLHFEYNQNRKLVKILNALKHLILENERNFIFR